MDTHENFFFVDAPSRHFARITRRARRKCARAARPLSGPRCTHLAPCGRAAIGTRTRSTAVGKDVGVAHSERVVGSWGSGHHVDKTRRVGCHARGALDVRNKSPLRPDRVGRRPAGRPPSAMVPADRMHVVAHSAVHRPLARPGGQRWNRICPCRGLPLDRAGPGASRAPVYAAAPEGAGHAPVPTWVDRRQALPAQQALSGRRAMTGPSPGISSTASSPPTSGSSAVSGRRPRGPSGPSGPPRPWPPPANPDLDPVDFVRSADTVYIAAPAHHQATWWPPGRRAARRRPPGCLRTGVAGGLRPSDPPVVLALDELANVAPLPELPSMVSEGGGQGLVTLACFSGPVPGPPSVAGPG